MKLSARAAVQTRQENKRLDSFGKHWKSGDTVVCLYTAYLAEDGQWDMHVAGCWGHKIDPKKIKVQRLFIPTTQQEGVESKVPKIQDVTYQFSKISPLFVKGEKSEKIERTKKKKLSEAALKEALASIEEEFKDKNSVVGPLTFVISTECVIVPLTSEGKPEVDKARLVTQDISDTRITSILGICADPQYGVNPEDGYVEIKYAFGSKGDKKLDGDVSPTGITPEYSLKNKYPTEWSKLKLLVQGLPKSSEMVDKRNPNFRPIESAKVLRAISTYCALESEFLDAVIEDDDVERLKKNAQIVADLRIPLEIHKDLLQDVVAQDTDKIINPDTGAPTIEKLVEKEDIEKAIEEQKTRTETIGDDSLNEDIDPSSYV